MEFSMGTVWGRIGLGVGLDSLGAIWLKSSITYGAAFCETVGRSIGNIGEHLVRETPNRFLMECAFILPTACTLGILQTTGTRDQ